LERVVFGAVLRRMADRRGLEINELTRRSGVAESEMQAVLKGALPQRPFLENMAPTLGLHAADLFVMAQVVVPEDLAPLDARAGRFIPRIVDLVTRLSLDDISPIVQHVKILPQDGRKISVSSPRLPQNYGSGPGGALIRLLANRNLDLRGSAHLLAAVTSTYLSATTYGQIGRDLEVLDGDRLAAFAAALGIDFCDLVALHGTTPSPTHFQVNPKATKVAELVWELRRLSADQIEELYHRLRVAQQGQEGGNDRLQRNGAGQIAETAGGCPGRGT